jgi:hypothetical protein
MAKFGKHLYSILNRFKGFAYDCNNVDNKISASFLTINHTSTDIKESRKSRIGTEHHNHDNIIRIYGKTHKCSIK